MLYPRVMMDGDVMVFPHLRIERVYGTCCFSLHLRPSGMSYYKLQPEDQTTCVPPNSEEVVTALEILDRKSFSGVEEQWAAAKEILNRYLEGV